MVASLFYDLLCGVFVGKFPIADAALSQVWICKRCKARNHAGVEMCRKCHSRYLRPKRKDIKTKK